jgi:glucose 1-dehydrogenase
VSPVVVVTGAAGGIGSATCDLFDALRWQVVAMDRRPVNRRHALQVDLSDAVGVTLALRDLPRVDALVNNAAVQVSKSIPDTTVEEWDEMAAVNIRAAFVCLRAVYSQLVAARGAVINVASVHASATATHISGYAATKGGLAAFTRAAAVEMGPLGVRVNAVLPGAIDTPLLRRGVEAAHDRENVLMRRTPLRRIGDPEEVAEAIAFLADGRRSGFITGQELVVDGGALARLSTE